jgi:hypothetical protein
LPWWPSEGRIRLLKAKLEKPSMHQVKYLINNAFILSDNKDYAIYWKIGLRFSTPLPIGTLEVSVKDQEQRKTSRICLASITISF